MKPQTPPNRYAYQHGAVPALTLRRYPSLSDDGQPWFPRTRHLETNSSEASTLARSRSPFPYVRVFALAGILAIIAALAFTA